MPAASAPGSRPGLRPGPRGLPRGQRIRKRPDFLRIQNGPARVGAPHLLLLFELRPEGGPPRLGVVASRKVGPAVARNRAKRLVREAFRLHQEMLPRGLDLVVVVRPGTHELTLADVAAEMAQAAPQIARRARRPRHDGGQLPPRPGTERTK
jgi:ribonuclease P protein component